MNIKHKKISKIKSFKDSLGRIWISCLHCELKGTEKCICGDTRVKLHGFCRNGRLRKKGDI
jgi:hypothetical protein